MIGIYDCFGYGTGYEVSFEERYKLIKNAGFDCVMSGGVINLAEVWVIKKMFDMQERQDYI